MGLERVDLNKQYLYITKRGELATVSKSWGGLARTWIKLSGGDHNIEHVVKIVLEKENEALKREFEKYCNQKIEDRTIPQKACDRFRKIREQITPSSQLMTLYTTSDARSWVSGYVTTAFQQGGCTDSKAKEAAIQEATEIANKIRGGDRQLIDEMEEKGQYLFFAQVAQKHIPRK